MAAPHCGAWLGGCRDEGFKGRKDEEVVEAYRVGGSKRVKWFPGEVKRDEERKTS